MLIILVTIIFVALFAIFFFDPLQFSKETIDAILPLATFTLAYIAVLTILVNHRQENQRRKQALLIEIDEWARNGHKILSGYLPKQTLQGRNDTLRLIAEINTRKDGMTSSARIFGSDLFEEVKKAAEELDLFITQLEGPIEDFASDSIEYANMDVLQDNCDKSLIKVFGVTSGLRAKLGI